MGQLAKNSNENNASQNSFGFGNTGEPAPETSNTSNKQTQTWGPLIHINNSVTPGSELKGAQLPGSPSHNSSTVKEWRAPVKNSAAEEKPKENLPWDLTADKVVGYRTNKVLEAIGKVYLTRGEEYLKADYARYYAATGWVYLKGNVEVYFGKDQLKAAEAEFDIANKVGWLKNGNVFMEGPHIYFSGKKINKHWGDMYTFHEAKITTCDGDVPAWSMQANQAVVEIDGYARLWSTAFNVKDQKIAYSPYMILPAKKDRQTGFLIPQMGQSSKKGITYNQPFFWAIDKSKNLTVNAEVMTKRGVMPGMEYWARPDLEDQIWMRMDWLNDAKTSKDDSGDGFSDGLYRTNKQRYWLRGMYDGSIPNSRWKLKADIDYVSDQYFLREFRHGPNGYNNNKDTLLNLFGREIKPWSSNRVSEGVIYRDWDRITVAGGMRYEQDPSLGHGNRGRSTDTIAQRLPEINVYLNKNKIVDNLPLELTGEWQAVNFYRRTGTRGLRYDLYPTLSMPILTKYFSLEPSFGIRQTQYQTEQREFIDGDTGTNDDKSRTLPEFSLAAYTELSRIYNLGSSLQNDLKDLGKNEWVSMRHSIQPRVTYKKRADINQKDLPYYDYLDRLGVLDEVTYSLTNVFGIQEQTVNKNKDNKPIKTSSYRDFIRFNIENGYDFEEAKRDWDRKTYPRRPFMDVLGELEFYPKKYLGVSSRTWVSPYNGDITRENLGFTVSKPNWGFLSASYDRRDEPDEYWRWRKAIGERRVYMLHRGLITPEEAKRYYTNSKISMLNSIIQLNYFSPISIRLEHWYDLTKNDSLEYNLTLTYTHQCFIINAEMYWDRQDTSYGISFALPGFWN